MRAKPLLILCALGATCSYFAGGALRALLSGIPPKQAPRHAVGHPKAGGGEDVEDIPETISLESLDAIHDAAAAAQTPAESRVVILGTLTLLSAKQLETLVLKHLEQPEFERLIRYDFQAAMRRLGEMQPRRAAEIWLSSMPKAVALRRHLAALIEPWMQKSPVDFVAWHCAQSEEAQRSMSGVIAQLALTQPDQFAELAESLSQSPAGVIAARRAMQGFRSKAGSKPEVGAALAFAARLPEGKLRSAALVALVEEWPEVDVSSVPELQAALASLPYAAREAKAAQFISKLENLEPGPLRQATAAAAIEAEAHKDSSSALKKLKTLVGSPDYPAAVRGFVEAVAERDPSLALDVTLTLPKGDEQRAIALDEAAVHLYRKKPDQARKWVEQASLSDEEYFHLTGRKR